MALKPVDTKAKPGLAKLPTAVRNKMGYAKKMGSAKKMAAPKKMGSAKKKKMM
jgi:hypothetical protein